MAGRQNNETTSAWLERIIGGGATDAQINGVRQILAGEQQAAPAHPPAPVAIVAPPPIYHLEINLTGCHDTDALLTLAYNSQDPGRVALQTANGFRHYARNQATAVGVTGYIIRTRHKNIHLVLQGTTAQLQQFGTWLQICGQQGMYVGMQVQGPMTQIPMRNYDNFSVSLDATRPYHPDAHPNGIIRGSYSDNHAEKLSQYSNSGGGGGSSYGGSSGDSNGGGGSGSEGGGGSSSCGYVKKGSGTGGKSSSKLASAGQTAIGAKRTKPAGKDEEGR